MSTAISDRWLLLTVGVVFAAAAFGIRYAITDILSLTEIDLIPRPSLEGLEVSDVAESRSSPSGNLTIKLSTLRTLVDSPQESIKTSAQAILVQRFISEPSQTRALVSDFFSFDLELHHNAFLTARFISGFIETHEDSWDSPIKLKTSRHAKIILRSLVYWKSERHLDSRTSLAPHDNMKSMDDGAIRTREMTTEFWSELSPACREWAGVKTHTVSLVSTPPGRRPVTTPNRNERRRRQRHREAMVFHEGSGQVEESDIIRPRA